MKGVIQRVYNSYRRNKGLEPRSVKLLTQTELEDIYRTLYWNKVDGDKLPLGLDYCVFDFAVNSGPSRAIKFLQKALNKVGDRTLKVDGNMGPATLDAATSYPPEAVIDEICNSRLSWVQTLKIWNTFGKGWKTRILGVKKDAKEMVDYVATLTKPFKPAVPPALGLPGDVKPTEVSVWEKMTGLLAAGGAGLMGVINNPYTLIFAMMLVVLGAVYLFWKYNKA